MRKAVYDNKHLTLDEKKTIQTGIGNDSSKYDIVRVLRKDPTFWGTFLRETKIRLRNNQAVHIPVESKTQYGTWSSIPP